MGRSRARSAAILLLAGALFCAGLWALASIPRGPREFAYGPFGIRYGTLEPLPFAAFNGFTPEQLSSHLARLAFLAPACALVGLLLGAWLLRRRFAPPPAWLLPALGAGLVALCAAVVTRGVPVQDDEATNRMQADLLARGVWADRSVPEGIEWAEPFTAFTPRGVTGKYLFGEPALLALGRLAGEPLAAHVALAFLALWLFQAAAAKRGAAAAGLLGTGLLAVSPAFAFTTATAMSQAPALCGLALMVWGLSGERVRGGLWAGTGLGLALVSRPQVAVPCGLVLLALEVRRDWRLVAWALAAAVPWLAALLAYDAALTGHLSALAWAGHFDEAYGFGDPFPGLGGSYRHTPLRGLALAAIALVRMNGWALGWPVSLAGPVAWIALRCPRRAAVAPWAAVALATFVFQAGYYSLGTSDTGPVYHHAALPFFALSAGAALEAAWQRRRAWLVGFAAACVALGTTSFFVEHALRLRRLTSLVEAPYRALGGRSPQLLFVDDARRRPMAGWVMGIPFRPRGPNEPVVAYPFESADVARKLAAAMPERTCGYLHYDWSAAAWQLAGCDGLDELVSRLDAARAERRRTGEAWAPDGIHPWHAFGRWRQAFPWALAGR